MPKQDNSLEEWLKSQNVLNKLFIHDLKNPISALSANLSYIEAASDGFDEDMFSALKDSQVAVKFLLFIANNILNISRLESQEHIERVPVGLPIFIRDSIVRAQEMINSSDNSIRLEGAVPNVYCNWELNYANLALDNLIICAVQNSPANGEVVVRVEASDSEAKILVLDNGVPIAPMYRDKLFSREFQNQAKSLSEARYGRAFGLYAAGLATKHLNGKIEAGELDGSTFISVTWPTGQEDL